MKLYLDNAATTQVRPEVIEVMLDSLKNYGNSEAKFYDVAENAKKEIDSSRKEIASAVGCESDEVVFTSGATESNNLFFKGYAEAHPNKKTIIVSSIEHSSISRTCDYLETLGYNIVRIPVDSRGLVNLEILKKTITKDTLFVSIIWVNNEIGTVQNMEMIDRICFEKGVPLHSDATQALGKVHIDLSRYRTLDFLTISAHKIYGPKGIGALIVRKKDGIRPLLVPLLHGGQQEFGYRGGTLSNELIVGFGKAVELAHAEIDQSQEHLHMLERVFVSKMERIFGNTFSVNNDFDERVYGILNCRFDGMNNMLLLQRIAPIIGASTGSACSVDSPSLVLKAIGLSPIEISNSIRFSFSAFQKLEDMNNLDNV